MKQQGRPPKYGKASVTCSLTFPVELWEYLDSRPGSRSDAFREAIHQDKGVKRLRKILKRKDER